MEMAVPGELPLVLLVDDDPYVLRGFARMARRLPLQFVTALSAEAALARISLDGPPALLISDYQLGGMDGLSLLMKISLEHPHVRLVLSTGTTKTPPPGSGIRLLPKPVEFEAFAQLMESLGPRPR